MKFLNTSVKKTGLMFAALLLSFALGSGMNKAFAGQGIQNLLTSWFDTKREASIEQIDKAITSEKERLVEELKIAIQTDIKRADTELAEFTDEEITLRVDQLQNYADELIKGLNIEHSAEKAAIQAKLDAALNEAKKLLDNSVPLKQPASPPIQEPGKDAANVNDKKIPADQTEDEKITEEPNIEELEADETIPDTAE